MFAFLLLIFAENKKIIIWGEIDLNLRFKVVIAFSQNRIQMRNINENCFNKRAITIKLMKKGIRNIHIFKNIFFFNVHISSNNS